MSSLKKELSQKSPVLTGLLQGECGPNGSKWKSSFVVMAAAIQKPKTLFASEFNWRYILYSGHASKTVSFKLIYL